MRLVLDNAVVVGWFLEGWDAAYVELALRLQILVATKEEPLQAAGVGVVRG